MRFKCNENVKKKRRNFFTMQKKRNIKITVRYSDEELEQAQANSQGVFASWLRSLSLNEKTKKIKPVDPQLLYELNHLSKSLYFNLSR